MTFSVSDILSYSRVLAKTDQFGLTNANGTAFIADALYDLRKKLISKREDFFIQEATRDITANEIIGGSFPGKFAFPPDMWLLKNIQVNLIDSSNQSLYSEASQVDSSNIFGNASWEYLKANQPIDQPLFDYRGDWFEIAPTPKNTITTGIKIFYFLAPSDLVNLTDTLTFPESLDMRPLAYKTASLYLASLGNPLSDKLDLTYNQMINNLISVTGSGEQTPTRSQPIRISGFEY